MQVPFHFKILEAVMLKPALKVLPILLALAAPLAPAQPPQAAAPPPVKRPDAELRRELDRFMSRLEAFGFSGALLVARDGRIVLEKGYGFANRERGVPFTAETVFDIGSITKQFTAAAILKLEMEGKLKVTDPLPRYFEGVPEDKRGITLHHLLTHSAGLVDILGGDYEEMPRDRLVTEALASKLLWAPGTRYRYSNLGYSLLAIVAEKVSGQPYEAFLQEHLLKPAGLTLTGYRGPKWEPARLAHGYSRKGHWGTPLDHAWAPDGPWWNLRGNGGLLSTVGDLYKWHRALEGEAILSSEAKEKYQAPHVPEGGGTHYGYGWSIAETVRGTKLVSHNGGNGIFAADFRRYVDDGVVVTIGSNRSDFSSIAIVPQITQLIFGLDVQMPPEPVKAEPKALERYLGSYTLPSGGRLTVAASPSDVGDPRYPGITVTSEGQDAFLLLAGGAGNPEKTREMEKRLLAALEEGRQGSFAAVGKLFGIPAAEAEGGMRDYVGPREAQYGKLKGFEAAGTVVTGERAASYVRFLFEKSSVLTEFTWQNAEVTNVRPVEGPLSLRFVPRSPAGFASYDPRSRRVTEIAFEDGGDGGGVAALVVKTAAGEVKATRASRTSQRIVHEASGIALALVPAGEFREPFYLGETEVTVGQFRRFVAATGYVTDAERGVQESGHGQGAFAATPDGNRDWSTAASWRNPFPNLPDYRVRDDHPVVHVSWNDAQRFAAHYGLALPSEAQWERAARAGSPARFAWGDAPAAGAGWANVADAAAGRRFPAWNELFPFDDGAVLLSAAGGYRPNAWGLRDLTGNVWEWCQDAYREEYPAAGADESPVQGDSRSARVMRGCSWLDGPDLCRLAARAGMYAYSRRDFIGFRVAMVQPRGN